MQSLGPWFSNALTRKVSSHKEVSLCLFYQYAKPHLAHHDLERLTKLLDNISKKHLVGGRIRIAPEGLNCTLSSSKDGIREFTAALSEFTRDGASTDKPFANTHFKYVDNLHEDRGFKDLKILPVKELVFYGAEGFSSDNVQEGEGGIHLDPKDFHEKLSDPNSVVIDVRNHYEAEIGRFNKQTSEGGATYIDPKMRKSTDFPAWLSKPETKAKLAGKHILMYCTGGVRCEMASVLLKKELEKNQSLEEQQPHQGIYQLQGGIENYFKTYEDGGHWNGANFVFDKREAFSVESGPQGVGGVVRKNDLKRFKNLSKSGQESNGKCCVCSNPWDRYIGKKHCATCGVLVLMCDTCMSSKYDKSDSNDIRLKVRCPLCKDENVTTFVEDTEFINNGKIAKVKGIDNDGSTIHHHNGGGGGASTTTLKWGGGHGKKKAKKEEENRRDLKRKECKFGDNCKRDGCFFFTSKRNDRRRRI